MVVDQSIELVIFDFDGTLFHLDVDWDSLRHVLMVQPDEKLGDVIQRHHADSHPDLQKVTDAELAGVKQSLPPQVAAVLQALVMDKKVAVLTRNTRLAVEKVLEGTRVENDVFIVGREDVRRMKPDPEGLATILDHFNTLPSQAVLVGDTYHDVEAAHAHGLKSIIVKNPKLTASPEGADSYIADLKELVNQ